MGKVINTTSKHLEKYKAETIKELQKLVAKTATTIEIEATRNAPRGEDGDVFINIDKRIYDNGLTAEVGVMGGVSGMPSGKPLKDEQGRVLMTSEQESHMSAYFEFGTGLNFYTVTAGYPQWIIDIAGKFIKNKKGTLKGKPYLYPSVLRNMPIFNKKIKEITDKEVKDE